MERVEDDSAIQTVDGSHRVLGTCVCLLMLIGCVMTRDSPRTIARDPDQALREVSGASGSLHQEEETPGTWSQLARYAGEEVLFTLKGERRDWRAGVVDGRASEVIQLGGRTSRFTLIRVVEDAAVVAGTEARLGTELSLERSQVAEVALLVEVDDSLWNGLLIGLGVGIAGELIFIEAVDDLETGWEIAPSFLLTGAAGIIVGSLIDNGKKSTERRVVYRAPATFYPPR